MILRCINFFCLLAVSLAPVGLWGMLTESELEVIVGEEQVSQRRKRLEQAQEEAKQRKAELDAQEAARQAKQQEEEKAAKQQMEESESKQTSKKDEEPSEPASTDAEGEKAAAEAKQEFSASSTPMLELKGKTEAQIDQYLADMHTPAAEKLTIAQEMEAKAKELQQEALVDAKKMAAHARALQQTLDSLERAQLTAGTGVDAELAVRDRQEQIDLIKAQITQAKQWQKRHEDEAAAFQVEAEKYEKDARVAERAAELVKQMEKAKERAQQVHTGTFGWLKNKINNWVVGKQAASYMKQHQELVNAAKEGGDKAFELAQMQRFRATGDLNVFRDEATMKKMIASGSWLDKFNATAAKVDRADKAVNNVLNQNKLGKALDHASKKMTDFGEAFWEKTGGRVGDWVGRIFSRGSSESMEDAVNKVVEDGTRELEQQDDWKDLSKQEQQEKLAALRKKAEEEFQAALEKRIVAKTTAAYLPKAKREELVQRVREEFITEKMKEAGAPANIAPDKKAEREAELAKQYQTQIEAAIDAAYAKEAASELNAVPLQLRNELLARRQKIAAQVREKYEKRAHPSAGSFISKIQGANVGAGMSNLDDIVTDQTGDLSQAPDANPAAAAGSDNPGQATGQQVSQVSNPNAGAGSNVPSAPTGANDPNEVVFGDDNPNQVAAGANNPVGDGSAQTAQAASQVQAQQAAQQAAQQQGQAPGQSGQTGNQNENAQSGPQSQGGTSPQPGGQMSGQGQPGQGQ